ncbi:MAG: tetratricopeptide repeat protein [Candidatus Eisenbacteria sp.]|nr:tetratricopeptide repeat protein [Candidatus Eisenbacteria bacterium]
MDHTSSSWGTGAGRPVPRGVGPRRPGLAASVALMAVLLLVGGCALLPSKSGSGAGTVEIVSHTVSSGETLASIADDYYGTPRAAGYLADVNRIGSGFLLEPGVLIDVPVGEEDIERYRRRTEAKILYNRGTMLADAGNYAKAQEELTAALRTDPRFVDAGYNLGIVLLAMGDPERAVAILEQVLKARPAEPLSEFALGKAHFDAGRVSEALEHFDRAVDLDPKLEDARFARAVALLELGERDEGVFALDLYLRDFPDGTWADSARAELEKMARAAKETTP